MPTRDVRVRAGARFPAVFGARVVYLVAEPVWAARLLKDAASVPARRLVTMIKPTIGLKWARVVSFLLGRCTD